MTFGATTYAEVPYAGTLEAPVVCTLAAYGNLAFGVFAYAGDDCPPGEITPIPPEPPTPGGGGGASGGRRRQQKTVIRFREPEKEQKQEREPDVIDDDEECIMAVLIAFSTHANSR